MADDDSKVPPLLPDVQSTALAPLSSKEATALARAMGGDLPPNRGVFWCLTCGFKDANGKRKHERGLTMEFDEEEMLALEGDPYAYKGPCPVCHSNTLVDFASMGGSDFSIRGRAGENRQREYGQAADIFLDKVTDRIGGMMGGAVAASTDGASPQSTTTRDDLPDANDIDLGNLKPRK